MSAGHGIEHSEYNASDAEPVHFLQIWIQPDRLNARPAYGQRVAAGDESRGRWALLASPDGADGSLAIRQDARLYLTRLETGAGIGHRWIRSAVTGCRSCAAPSKRRGRKLAAGDAIGWTRKAASCSYRPQQASEVLLFDLP
jgi:redox-sensitive bicupin YhaK (pirin superfamily)